MNRREMLQALLTCTVVAVAPQLGTTSTGDDTERIQALLDRGISIDGGTWRISRTLHVRRPATIRNATLLFSGSDSPVIFVHAESSRHEHGLTIEHCRFEECRAGWVESHGYDGVAS